MSGIVVRTLDQIAHEFTVTARTKKEGPAREALIDAALAIGVVARNLQSHGQPEGRRSLLQGFKLLEIVEVEKDEAALTNRND